MADSEQVTLSPPKDPSERSIEAFEQVSSTIKKEILASRKHWDAHEPRMWSKAKGVSDQDLVNFDVKKDLVLIRAGVTTYGTIIFGKIRIPSIPGGFVHVRIHDPPDEQRSTKDVLYHSLYTEEGNKDQDGRAHSYRAILDESDPIEFFNE